MTDFIACLEAAIGPHRDLDVEIWEYIGLSDDKERHCMDWCKQNGCTDLTRDDYLKAWAPRYTESLDAALTLIPPRWDVREADSNGGLWCIVLGRGDSGHPDYREVFSWPGDHERGIFHRKPPALAFCIAALKARAV